MNSHVDSESGYCRALHIRDMGSIVFVDVTFHMDKIQAVFTYGETVNFEKIQKVAVGDLMFIEGKIGLTKTGQKSVFVSRVSDVKKNVSGLAHQQIQSQHERFSNRHADIGLHPESMVFWKTYSQILSTLRKTLGSNGFMEFETGVLQDNRDAGLASAFVTKRKGGGEYFLSLTSELKLKRLLAGGFERVYELGQSFRNEGSNKEHLPEFSLLEAYAIEWSAEQLMGLIEQIARETACLSGLEKFRSGYRNNFSRVEFYEFWRMVTGKEEVSLAVLCEKFPEVFKSKMPEFTWIYKFICKYVAPTFERPTFVTHIPIGFSPFAKVHNEDHRFMEGGVYVADRLHVATFSEDNNDYEEIKASLEKQNAISGVAINEPFLDVLKFGIPPSAGLGLGINRLLMTFLGSLPRDARETSLYPVT
jgi:lysyl-tRNA synthetase class 2